LHVAQNKRIYKILYLNSSFNVVFSGRHELFLFFKHVLARTIEENNSCIKGTTQENTNERERERKWEKRERNKSTVCVYTFFFCF